MGCASAVVRLSIVTLGDLLFMGGTVYTLFKSSSAAFTPRLVGGFGLLMYILDFVNAFLVRGGEGGVSVSEFGVVGNKLFEH